MAKRAAGQGAEVIGSYGVTTRTCGEAITAGDMVAIHTDGKVYKANAAVGASQQIPCVGMAEIDGASGGVITITRRSVYCDGATDLSPGATLYLGETDGAVTTTKPSTHYDAIQAIGHALSATEFVLDIGNCWVDIVGD